MYKKYQHSLMQTNELLSPFQEITFFETRREQQPAAPAFSDSTPETSADVWSDEEDTHYAEGILHKENVVDPNEQFLFEDVEDEHVEATDLVDETPDTDTPGAMEEMEGGEVGFDQLLSDINDLSDFHLLYSEWDVFGKSIYIDADLKIAGTTNITGIFLPRAFRPSDHFEIIIYLHGFKFDTSKNDKVCYKGICPTTTIDYYWRNPMFPLREYMNRAGRNAILVAPTLGVRSKPGTLILERGFDLFMNQVLRALLAENAISPAHLVGRIILAGHSGGGDVMVQLVSHKDKFARLITECWCYDALYGGTASWINWLKANAARRFYSYYLGKSPRAVSVAIKSAYGKDERVYIKPSDIDDHWDLVKEYWKERLFNRRSENEIAETNENAADTGEWEPVQYRLTESEAPAVTTCDPDIAIPAFTNKQKSIIDPKLLTATENKKALLWNKAFFKKTNTDPLVVSNCLERYVHLAAVRKAIDEFNATHPANKIEAGTSPVDAVLTEAIHQFQLKSFFDPASIDGKAGAATLQSIGIIALPAGGNSNTFASKELKRLGIRVMINGKACDHRNWFQFTYNPSFLGIRFNATVHYLLLKQLRIAEAALLALPRFKDDSLVQLAAKLGYGKKTGLHGGGRSGDAGMHIFGLAIDIDHQGNPWIGAGWIEKPANYDTLDVTTRQRIDRKLSERTRLIQTLRQASSKALTGNTIFAYLNNIGITFGADTRRAHQELKDRNDEFISFLQTHPAELSFWQNSATFDNRDPLDGFLHLDADLVYALRQTAGLAWGAIDFGPAASGDIMHFDMRTMGVSRTINTGKRPKAGEDPVKTHPLLRIAEEVAGQELHEHDFLFSSEETQEEDDFETVDQEEDLRESAAGEEDETSFEEWVPAVTQADVKSRIDEYFKLANAKYTLPDGSIVNAWPQFRYAKSAFTPEAAAAKLKDAFISKSKTALYKKQKVNIHFSVYGRPKPGTLASLTQDLIDIGEFADIQHRFSLLSPEQQVRKLQREFGIGIDCAGYVQLAFIFAYTGNDNDPEWKRESLGLKKRRGDEKLNDLSSVHFKKIDLLKAETGDLIILKPRAGDADRAWHTVIVVEHSSSGDVHTFVVDASWGTDLYGEDAGGVGRRSLMHDAAKKTWWDIHPLDGTEANENLTGPYNGHTLHGVFRARQKK